MNEGEIEFIQYLRPNGRQTKATITRPSEIVAQANALRTIGARFEMELLTTGMVSMEVVIPGDSEEPRLLSFRLCNNGPTIPCAVDQLITAASNEAKALGLLEDDNGQEGQ